MKFGQQLYRKMIPEWRQAFIDYEVLKTLLKPLKVMLQKYRNIPLPTASRKKDMQFSLTNYTKEEVDKLGFFIEKFEFLVNSEFEKATSFFKAKLVEYLKKFRLLKINVIILDTMAAEPDFLKHKGEIKNCFHSFYKELILLQEFYTMNYEALRKILKKEKKLIVHFPRKLTLLPLKFEDLMSEECFLQANIPKVHTLKQDLETFYLDRFYQVGEKDKGRVELNKIIHGRFTSHWENFQNGMFLGFSILLLAMILILSIQIGLDPDGDINFFYVFHVFRGFALILIYMWFLAWNIYGWTSNYVNYKHILNFNYHYSTLSEVIRRTSIFTSIFLLMLLCYILMRDDKDFQKVFWIFPIEIWPIFCWLSLMFYLFFPSSKYFNYEGRRFFFILLKKIMFSPFLHIDFLITWGTEQLLSFVIPIRDMEFSICYYIQKIYDGEDGLFCSFEERMSLSLIATVLPLLLRMIQCIKLSYQKHGKITLTSDFFNCLRYSLSLITVIFSFLFSLNDNSNVFFTLWIIFAVLSTIYSYYWDLKVDWGFLEKNSKHKYLRSQLSYSSPYFYYGAIFLNLFLRFFWILTLSPGIMGILMHRQAFSFTFGIIEMIRRVIWNFFRLEKEHIANCGEFKVVEDFKLPFEKFTYNFDEKKMIYGELENTKKDNNTQKNKTSNRGKSNLQEALLTKFGENINFTSELNLKRKDSSKFSIEAIKKEVQEFKQQVMNNDCFFVVEDIESLSSNKISINNSNDEEKKIEKGSILKETASFGFHKS